MSTTKITIRAAERSEEVEATFVLDRLAVHKTGLLRDGREWSALDYGWTITHIASGLAVAKDFYLEESAISACKCLVLMESWTFEGPDDIKPDHLARLATVRRQVVDTWADVGRPEVRAECYDRIDSDLGGFVIGRDDEDEGKIYVAEERDGVVSCISSYYYVDSSMTVDDCCYWEQSDWNIQRLFIEDCLFYRGMPMGDFEVDPEPFNIDEDQAEEWGGAYLGELSTCEECDLYLDTNDNAYAIISDCTLICNGCVKELQDRGELCCHNHDITIERCDECAEEGCCNQGCADECDCDTCNPEEEIEDPQTSSSIGYPKEGDIVFDFSQDVHEFKRELETKLFPHMDREAQHEILNRRIEGTLKEAEAG